MRCSIRLIPPRERNSTSTSPCSPLRREVRGEIKCCFTSSATFHPTPSSPRIGFPSPTTIVFIRIDASFPTDVLQVREFEIRPRLDVFGNVMHIILWLILHELFAIWINHSDFAIIKIGFVVFIDQTHVIGLVSIHIAQNQIHVWWITQHNFVEELKTELCKLNSPMSHFLNFESLFFSDAFCHPAGDGTSAMCTSCG